ncbi:MAG: hypothetical protein QM442_06250 [Spirochaetota bacterium]|nr:hypothetical protein [Spirochaetota bacterium]
MKKDIEKELNQRSVFFGINKNRGFRLQSPSRALQFHRSEAASCGEPISTGLAAFR